MVTAFADFLSHLDSHHVQYTTSPMEEGRVNFTIHTSIATYAVSAFVDPEYFQVRLQFPFRIPQGSRADVCQAITRANFGLRLGSFQFDVDDGELIFNVFHLLEQERLPEDVSERIISTSLSMLNQYGHAFLSIVYGNEDPKDAIIRVEQNFASRTNDEDKNGEELPENASSDNIVFPDEDSHANGDTDEPGDDGFDDGGEESE